MDINTTATMRGVVYVGEPYNMTVQDLPRPQIQAPTDAIVRITTSAICGSDLHTYHGFVGGNPPYAMGHEAIGYIESIGDGVSQLSEGDYVIIPDTPSIGYLNSKPQVGNFYGQGSQELSDGLQSEYARVPFADTSLMPIPVTHNTTNSTIEQDYLTVSDIFPTGWAALDFAGFQPGDTVAVFGAGPVGLLSAYSAMLRGAAKVYSIDHVAERLERAASIGAVPINFASSDPVAQILAHEPNGVMRSVDCVGMEAQNQNLELDEGNVLRNMVAVTHKLGGLGQVGVYGASPNSTGAPRGSMISRDVKFPLTEFWTKSLSYQGGAVDPKMYAPMLVDLIKGGKAQPSFIKSAEIGIEDAPEYYGRFSQQQETKVFIHFP